MYVHSAGKKILKVETKILNCIFMAQKIRYNIVDSNLYLGITKCRFYNRTVIFIEIYPFTGIYCLYDKKLD